MQPQLLESDYAVSAQDRISEHSCTTSTNVPPSAESLEFTPQFTLPVVRLFGGLFVHNCDEVRFFLISPSYHFFSSLFF